MATTDVDLESRALAFGPVRVRCTSAVPRELAGAWAREFRSWFGPGRTPVPSAPSAAHVALLAGPLGLLVAKRERVRGVKRALVRSGLRPFQCNEAFDRRVALLRAGIATARPVASIWSRATVEGCAVSRFVAGCDPWTLLAGSRDARRERARVVEALADFVADLHAAGFRHRDLKAPNLLLDASRQKLAVCLVDVDSLEHGPRVSQAKRIRDLARLCVSYSSSAARSAGIEATDWERCIQRYLQRTPDAAANAGELVARTRGWAREYAARLRARGRPIA